uniref:Uncharacterized protein n=1 Tax=viral metagenome TaxID=1070528 RepID=A0A6C0JAP7_9ZZZZ
MSDTLDSKIVFPNGKITQVVLDVTDGCYNVDGNSCFPRVLFMEKN